MSITTAIAIILGILSFICSGIVTRNLTNTTTTNETCCTDNYGISVKACLDKGGVPIIDGRSGRQEISQCIFK